MATRWSNGCAPDIAGRRPSVESDVKSLRARGGRRVPWFHLYRTSPEQARARVNDMQVMQIRAHHEESQCMCAELFPSPVSMTWVNAKEPNLEEAPTREFLLDRRKWCSSPSQKPVEGWRLLYRHALLKVKMSSKWSGHWLC